MIFTHYFYIYVRLFRVFEEMKVTKNDWSGDVLFLEDDNYVAPDILHMLRLLRQKANMSKYSILNVGNFLKAEKQRHFDQV